ncbi:hypothetical protein RN001_009943 [Aquatica leii]|uniref:Uncharacterized protein n=1 Tax=Aquatica leii TaxID=1421715 RepID=A0AAN7P5V9_9COLE|nr:hypothetical protein RN001_009943 [Aquatica leii]
MKLRRAEGTSDLQNEADKVVATFSKRKRRPTQRLLDLDSSEEDTASKFSRSPTIIKNVASQQQLEVLEPVTQCSIPISTSSTSQSSLSGLDSSIVENSTLTTCLALQKKLTNDVIFIKEQNKFILDLLRQQTTAQDKTKYENLLPSDFPIKLPINAYHDIQALEQYL